MARIELSHIGNIGTLTLTTTGTSGAATLVGSTLNIPVYQGQLTLTTTGIGAATLLGDTLNIPTPTSVSPAGSAGQVQFNSTPAGSFAASANLAWDDLNVRLNIGNPSAPAARVNVKGGGATSSTATQVWTNSGNTELMRVRDDGNVGIGTPTPSSRLTVQGTTATDGGQLGAELLSAAGWTSAGWTGDYTTGFTHTTGNTTALTNTLAAVSGDYYQIAYTVSGRTAGTFTVTFGGITSSSLSATGSFGPRATSTGALSITPTSDFNGTIALSVKTITAGSATISLFNSSGTVANEIRGVTSSLNTFVGFNSGAKNTTGDYNAGFGCLVLADNTTGSYNTGIGSLALYRNTTGAFNMAVGYNALTANTSGSSNIAVGFDTLRSNTTGSGNVANGYAALSNNTTANNNTSLGNFSLRANVTGSNNTAAGTDALSGNTTGSNNSAIGFLALQSNTTGSGNCAFGFYSGYNSTTTLTGSSNILIGDRAAQNIAGVASSNLVLGNSINLPSPTGSNQAVIKNIIFATGASGTGTTIAGSVGIGVNAPTGRLNIRGENTSSGTNAFLVQNSTPSDLYKIENNGKISYWATNTAAGTTGAQTIDRPSGTVNFGIGASALVVTNSLCTTASIVFATVRTNDATAYIKNVVPAGGSFTINLGAAATAETSVGFFIIN